MLAALLLVLQSWQPVHSVEQLLPLLVLLQAWQLQALQPEEWPAQALLLLCCCERLSLLVWAWELGLSK